MLVVNPSIAKGSRQVNLSVPTGVGRSNFHFPLGGRSAGQVPEVVGLLTCQFIG